MQSMNAGQCNGAPSRRFNLIYIQMTSKDRNME